jgi:D-alanine-D-alanine ligase-like ATP-grasp enzyme
MIPDAARYAKDAAGAIGAEFTDLDEGGGYLFRISKNGRSVVAGAGGVSSFPKNSATAFTLSRDKSHTKSVLRSVGIPVIDGGLFFAHTLRAGMRGPGREIDDARAFAASLGYPVFAKPNQGSRGNFAEIVDGDEAMLDYAKRVATEFESFLVEPLMRGVEHRVLIHEGRAVFHAVKSPPSLTGDGKRSAARLLGAFNAALQGTGVSPYPVSVLSRAGCDPSSVPASGHRIA